MRLLPFLLISTAFAADPALHITTPMPPPAWAMLERKLLEANSIACDRFAKKYLDSRGYLAHTPRWGTLDGPDDAIETFYDWTLLYAMGGSEDVLKHYKRAYEGHLRQYGELRTKLTELAKNGAYYKEFITQSDWFHIGEGMRGFHFLGLADPNAEMYRARVKRFAGLYMNEDPEAQNYDPEKKIIKSIWTGSQGPMLRKATTYDWVGDPVPGSFHLLHNSARRGKLLNLEANYKKMLAHCDEYLDSVGDNFLNLAATNLAVNAYALTGEEKYKKWIQDYVGAWRARAAETGGNIPSNVGLDGKLGGAHDGQWWKGTYGWNFTIFDGEIEKIAHRNYVTAGSWPGFSNALLVTGDQGFIDVLRKQMDNIYAQKKTVNGRVMIPQMYGDPKGYKFNGKPEWYQWTPDLMTDRLAEIYFWSMNPKDLERVPLTGFLGYLEGKDPDYPTKSFQKDFAELRRNMEAIDKDETTADTRLADYLLDMNPAVTDTLANLTMGAYFSRGKIWTLHARFRYFDPARLRAGLPEDVGALVEKMGDKSATLTLVNTNPIDARVVTVQAGGYGEHRFDAVVVNGKRVVVNGPLLNVRLEAGTGAKLEFEMTRYQNPLTLAQPWARGF